jgi:23S rRNA (guanosine2251-2'-O)-methyltransferase
VTGGRGGGAKRNPARRLAPGTREAVGGRRPALEAVRSGSARRLLVAETSRDTQGLRELRAAAVDAGIALEVVPRASLDVLGVRNHQGVIALVRPRPGSELDERGLGEFPFADDAVVVVLDGVTDPQNLGACARAAEAAGAAMLVTRHHRAAPPSAAAVRASAGALLHLPVARVANITRAIERLQGRGFHVVGLEQGAPTGIHDGPPPPRPVGLVTGAEGAGLSRLVREACDELVSIPLPGRTGSLNAAAALAVGLFGYVLRPA